MTRAYDSTKWLMSKWLSAVPGSKNGGIVGDAAHQAQGGYHIGRNFQSSSNYSVANFAADRRGPGDSAAAVDVTMNTANMKTITARLKKAAQNRDPRLVKHVRAFNGTENGTSAIRIEVGNYGQYWATPDHTWHVHLEIYREFSGNDTKSMNAMAQVLEVITGKPAGSISGAKPAGETPLQPAVTGGGKLRRPWPSWMPKNHYFGNLNGPNASRGGSKLSKDWQKERAEIKAIQERIIALGYVPGIKAGTTAAKQWADGLFEKPTVDAIARWQRAKYNAQTTRYGEVWSDDWARLFTY